MGAVKNNVVVPNRIPEEVFRKHHRILHLKKDLSAAQVTSILVLNEVRLLAEHTPKVRRGFE